MKTMRLTGWAKLCVVSLLSACGVAAAPAGEAVPDAVPTSTGVVEVHGPAIASATAVRLPCANQAVVPGADVTATLTAALAAASVAPVAGLSGPSGADQGRVYLGPGDYGVGRIEFPSNVRLEIDPGATLHPVGGPRASNTRDWGVFVFGTAEMPTTNATIIAGDGCGGQGLPTSVNKPTNTSFRGNDPAAGMANMAIPLSGWDVDDMWVFDLDPGLWGVNVHVTGFLFHWADDVEIGGLFTIQNASRVAVGIGPVPGHTSRTTAMMFDPLDGSTFDGSLDAAHIPQGVYVHDHYNILSPSGQGPNQVRACVDCRFERIFTHGGVGLRVETDGIPTLSGSCVGTGPQGVGFKTFAIVDRTSASDISAAYANRVVMLTPHCLPNGVVTVDGIEGWSVGELAVAAASETGGQGSFQHGSVVRDITGCGGPLAQEPHPDQDGYLLFPSRVALLDVSATVEFAGPLTWPAATSPGGLSDGTAVPGATRSTPPSCALPT